MRQFGRVWIEDEKGKLKPIFVKTGVTDNNYTEIVGGNLKEGQEIITGVASGSSQGFPGPPRMMMFR